MKLNQEEYVYYVVLRGEKIESGWSFASDAEDQARDNLPFRLRLRAGVYTKRGLRDLNLDPDNDEDWFKGGEAK